MNNKERQKSISYVNQQIKINSSFIFSAYAKILFKCRDAELAV